jgi:hypothetical protein
MINKSKIFFLAILNSKILIFLIMSFVSIISFGIDLSAHQIYNLSELALMEVNYLMEDSFYAFNHSPYNPLYYYIKIVVPILKYGAIFIPLSFILKFFYFIFTYKILSHFVEKNIAVLLSIIFLMAYLYASHGVIANGFWASNAVFPAAISSLISLVGIYVFLKKRYFLSGIAFGASIMIHPLYGISTLAFLSIGFLVILIKNKDGLFLRNLFLGMSPILFSILYIAYFRVSSNIDIESTYSFYEWFKYTSIPPSANISILWSLFKTGYCLVPIFIAGFYLAYVKKKYSALEILTISSSVMVLIFTCIEIIHLSGIFFDQFSEFFIAAQFRRGIWVAVLFSLIQITKAIFERKKEIFTSNSFTFLLIFSVSTYIFPSPVSIILMYGLLFIIFKNKISSALFVSAILMSILYFSNIQYNFQSEIKTLIYSLIFSIGVIAMMKLLKYKISDIHSRFFISIILIIIFLFSARGIHQKKLGNDISILINNGLFSISDARSLENFVENTKFDDKATKCMNNESKKTIKPIIQLPINGPRNTVVSLFPFEQLYGYYNPMYSRVDFELAIRGLKRFYGENFVDSFFKNNDFYTKEKLNQYFLDAFNKISKQRLTQLRDEQGLRFYLLRSEREDLNSALVCKGDKYFVYDVNLI